MRKLYRIREADEMKQRPEQRRLQNLHGLARQLYFLRLGARALTARHAEPSYALAGAGAFVQSTAMKAKDSSHARPSTAIEQAAAVCYRIGKSGIEFLLVQTGGGRWTFPKGNAESGLTHAQSAALEAFEEAGVHGRMEEDAFARYIVRKRKSESGAAQVSVSAHLCEVMRLEQPQEPQRNPTWFSTAKAKQRLREHRGSNGGADLARVVDRALARVQRLCRQSPIAGARKDPLQEVQFESSETPVDSGRLYQALVRDLRRSELQSSVIQLAVDAYLGEAPRLNPPPEPMSDIDSSNCATPSTPVGDW